MSEFIPPTDREPAEGKIVSVTGESLDPIRQEEIGRARFKTTPETEAFRQTSRNIEEAKKIKTEIEQNIVEAEESKAQLQSQLDFIGNTGRTQFQITDQDTGETRTLTGRDVERIRSQINQLDDFVDEGNKNIQDIDQFTSTATPNLFSQISGIQKTNEQIRSENKKIRSFNKSAQRFNISIGSVREKTDPGLRTPTILGPGAGPAPGSMGHMLQLRVESTIATQERRAKQVTQPLLTISEERRTKAFELKAKGQNIQAGIEVSKSTAVTAGFAFFQGLTAQVRPGLIRESVQTGAGLVGDVGRAGFTFITGVPTERPFITALRAAARKDLPGLIVSLPAGALGGITAGKIGQIGQSLLPKKTPAPQPTIEEFLPFESEAGLFFPQEHVVQRSLVDAVFVPSGEVVVESFIKPTVGSIKTPFSKTFGRTGSELVSIVVPEGVTGRPVFRPQFFRDIQAEAAFTRGISTIGFDQASLLTPKTDLGLLSKVGISTALAQRTPTVTKPKQLQLLDTKQVPRQPVFETPTIQRLGTTQTQIPILNVIPDIAQRQELKQKQALIPILDLRLQEVPPETPPPPTPPPFFDFPDRPRPPILIRTKKKKIIKKPKSVLSIFGGEERTVRLASARQLIFGRK